MPDPTPEQPSSAAPPNSSIGVNVDAIVSEIAESAPHVQEHTIAAHTAKQTSAPTDSDGVGFDPALHATGSDGKGILTAAGRWRKKRGAAATARSQIGGAKAGTGTSGADQAATATGIACAEMTIGTCTMIFGPEWQARVIKSESGEVTLDEREYMSKCYADYCNAKGIKDIPPGVALTMSLLAYAAPRFAQPETAERAGTIREWVACKVASWKVKKELKKRGIVGATVKVHRVGHAVKSGKFQVLVNGEPWKG